MQPREVGAEARSCLRAGSALGHPLDDQEGVIVRCQYGGHRHCRRAREPAQTGSLGREPGRTWPRRAASYLRERETAIGQHEPVMIDPVLAAEVTHFLHADAQRVLQPPLGSLIHAPPHFSAWLPGGPSWLPALADTLRLEHLSELASKLT